MHHFIVGAGALTGSLSGSTSAKLLWAGAGYSAFGKALPGLLAGIENSFEVLFFLLLFHFFFFKFSGEFHTDLLIIIIIFMFVICRCNEGHRVGPDDLLHRLQWQQEVLIHSD